MYRIYKNVIYIKRLHSTNIRFHNSFLATDILHCNEILYCGFIGYYSVIIRCWPPQWLNR